MQIEKSFAWELLNESWFDITEEFEELFGEWYGELSGILPDRDADYDDIARSLISGFRYWRFDPDQMSTYEKLRSKYGTLYESHMNLIAKYSLLLRQAEIAQTRRERVLPKLVSTTIKGGCIYHCGRRKHLDDKTIVA
jgi:hypothetical protein